MNRDVTNELFAKQVSVYELSTLMLAYFGRGTGSGTRKPRYHKEEDESNYVELQYGNHGNIIKIFATDKTYKRDIGPLKSILEGALINDQIDKIGQSIAFSSVPIKGYYRYKNQFQINPALKLPKDTHPHPQYPFLFQYKYTASNDEQINNRRQQKAFIEYTRIINLIVNGTIEPPPRYTEMLWVYTDDMKSTKWGQWGYIPIEPIVEAIDFISFEDRSRIDVMPLKNYYSTAFGIAGNGLLLPDATTEIIDKMTALDSVNKEKLNRASIWFKMSSDVYNKSTSSSFNALATCIECLLNKETERCKCCGHTIYETTERFLNFLITYAKPSKDVQASIKNTYKKYYPLRSDLSHGTVLLHADLFPWEHFNEKSSEEYFIRNGLYQTVHVALINWIFESA